MASDAVAGERAGRGARYYGWRIVVFCAISLGLTSPGQTQGVSVFVDPMMEALGLDRATFSATYLAGTLGGAAALPAFGRMLDRRGTRFTMTVVGIAFACVLAAMSRVSGPLTLVLGFMGLRMLGQGALAMIATTAVSFWFDRMRGRALGISVASGQALMTVAPVTFALVVTSVGWRQAWVVTAGVVGTIALLIARLGMKDGPYEVGQVLDGDAPSAELDEPQQVWGVDRRVAMRVPMFWALSGGVFTTGLIATALSFHQISILGEQGLTALEAAANFIPQTAAGLGGTLLIGALVDRTRASVLLLLSMGSIAGAVLILPAVAPGWMAMSYGALIGAAGGSARALEAGAMPKLFGTRHLGSLRGVAMGSMVVGSAFGPYLVALGQGMVGSYIPVVRGLLVLPVAVAATALVAERHLRHSPVVRPGY